MNRKSRSTPVILHRERNEDTVHLRRDEDLGYPSLWCALTERDTDISTIVIERAACTCGNVYTETCVQTLLQRARKFLKASSARMRFLRVSSAVLRDTGCSVIDSIRRHLKVKIIFFFPLNARMVFDHNPLRKKFSRSCAEM